MARRIGEASQNVKNMNSYNQNMTVLVNYLRDNLKKDDSSTGLTSGSTPRTAKLTMPAKVLSWTKDMSLETYSKQI